VIIAQPESRDKESIVGGPNGCPGSP